MQILLDGKKLANLLEQKIANILKKLNLNPLPKLGIIQVGNLEESNIYIRHKLDTAKRLGFEALLFKYSENISNETLLNEIKNIQEKVDGLIVQLPLPPHLNKIQILNNINETKDIDGLNEINAYKLKNQENSFLPATALGIIILANYYKINLTTTSVGVVGESQIVGLPVKYALLCKNKNVTSYNKESNINYLNKHDVLIVATGVKHLITKQYVKQGASVFDVGIHRDKNNKITGDCDFENIKDMCYAITPVPGGVGPMTVISLIINLLISYTNTHTQYKKYFKDILDLANFSK
ncbi:bifunctional 5,10-methylenetetrahydrofolate dehydrogenase/5,10-methenyltetrahydrofolate cyclohydrolase [Mycoplasma zalophi]|uniref:bifunctional 5,10-methylenetetrahydrofolate dehydrogenase/5,10-methenyltetrahydrofolate cyclohydrolase n=1 Tax=Mycoplasma zalophi TaxID=191287 RepID=UPI0021C835E8|nr:bifunctional 5,10-methylenetetrahydrofolate dehydrogenase/5,10-methenyltetrahydrofolate cyclohydrolase [Mycoplasma zalophi]MCU4117124.1 bifunctional 5,10-methylenetetrahydrofolate dehydrogenase/5,10-methenyltetrahydrofolate cyclohydrolase [Mycoplasma zalophi]